MFFQELPTVNLAFYGFHDGLGRSS